MKKWFAALTCATFLLPCLTIAQKGEGMLIYQIDGNRYQRENYDAKGILKNYQTIEVGELNTNDEKIEVKMTVISYDDKDKLLSASQTTFSCDPKAKVILMGVFPFAGGKSKKSLKVEMPEGELMYPAGWQQKSRLGDFNFRLKLEGGAAGFFGTESRVTISQRKASMQQDGTYRVSGKMTLKAYVAGFRISTTVFDYTEDIDQATGIVRQKFEEKTGEYFTIELKIQ